MPLVEVHLLAGRSDDVKSELARSLTEAMVHSLGSDPDRVQVVFKDHGPADWYRAGEPVASGPAAVAP